MFEVEAKVPISKKDCLALRKRLKSEAKHLGLKRNEDTYYEDPKRATIRIRRNKDKYSFDLKLRETINGIESNKEMEWEVADVTKWRRVLKRLGIRPRIRKTKKAENFELDGFHIELNEVRGLGFYLEIETIVEAEKDILPAKKKLIKLFSKLGYSKKQFEPKRYLELLANV